VLILENVALWNPLDLQFVESARNLLQPPALEGIGFGSKGERRKRWAHRERAVKTLLAEAQCRPK
jgi:hypothetical protein